MQAIDPPFEDNHLNFIIAIEVNMAAGFSWWPYIGNLARLTRTSARHSGPTSSAFSVLRRWARSSVCWRGRAGQQRPDDLDDQVGGVASG